ATSAKSQLAGLIPASRPNRYPRIASITPGSLPSSLAATPFCASVASGVQVNSTTWRNIAVPSVVSGPSAPGQHRDRVGQHRADVAQDRRPEVAVHDPVIEGERERRHLAHRELPLMHPRHLSDLAKREDRRLAR